MLKYGKKKENWKLRLEQKIYLFAALAQVNKMNIVASIEARMNSSRYPGKMIANINGKKTIERVIERVKLSKYVNKIVLATTINSNDDILCSAI